MGNKLAEYRSYNNTFSTVFLKALSKDDIVYVKDLSAGMYFTELGRKDGPLYVIPDMLADSVVESSGGKRLVIMFGGCYPILCRLDNHKAITLVGAKSTTTVEFL